jgi:hypothetical protein
MRVVFEFAVVYFLPVSARQYKATRLTANTVMADLPSVGRLGMIRPALLLPHDAGLSGRMIPVYPTE